MSDTPALSEIAKVRRHECRMRGHDWAPVVKAIDGDPVRFYCLHCGRVLDVVASSSQIH